MGRLVVELTPQGMAEIARYYADIPQPTEQTVSITQDEIGLAERLYWLGDPDRLIQPCSRNAA